MITHNLQQGTTEWLEYRANHFNASDAPAMMGKSIYKTRSRLLDEMATGLIQEVDTPTQHRFNEGHRFEALARPIAAQIIGEDLYPVTGSQGRMSASFDGLTMDESIAFEHKSLNDDIRNTQSVEYLRIDYCIQMEQQLLVSGAGKCLFLATKWDDNDNLLEQKQFWYEPDLELREQIINGWNQFEKDLETHVPAVIVEMPKAETIMQLPAINVQVSGGLQSSNLKDVIVAFDGFLENANTRLVTDEDFANGEATAKFSRDTAKKLKLTRQQIIDQVADISEATRIIDLYAGKFDALGLKLEKLVKSEKEAIKIKIANDAVKAYSDHKSALEAEISPIMLIVEQPNFAEAMKNKRTLESLNDAVNTELANAKIAADAVAKDIRAKLAVFNEMAADHKFLFNDIQSVIYESNANFDLIVRTRIEDHKKSEEEKLEAVRENIRLEEEAKANAKAKAEKERADKQESESPAIREEDPVKIDQAPVEQPIYSDQFLGKEIAVAIPTRSEMVSIIANEIMVHEDIAEQWLIETFGQEKESA